MMDYLGAEICQIATKVLDFKKYFLGLSFSLFCSKNILFVLLFQLLTETLLMYNYSCFWMGQYNRWKCECIFDNVSQNLQTGFSPKHFKVERFLLLGLLSYIRIKLSKD